MKEKYAEEAVWDKSCCFAKSDTCLALSVTKCPAKCSFYKTQYQFDKAQVLSERILVDKGLDVVHHKGDSGVIVTTKPVMKVKVNRAVSES